DRIRPERFDLLGQLDFMPVDLNRERAGDRRGDVGIGNGPKELSVAARLRAHGKLCGFDTSRKRLCLGKLVCLTARLGFVLGFDLRQRAFVGFAGELARKQEVPGVAVGDVDDVAFAPQRFNVAEKNELHGAYSDPNGRNAMRRARLTATVSIRWCLAQFPEMRRGTIFPRSETYFL